MKSIRILLIVLICLVSLCALYLGFVFFAASGFMFAGDIDLAGEQLEAAKTRAAIGSLFGLILMFLSLVSMVFSGKISKRILNSFGAKLDE